MGESRCLTNEMQSTVRPSPSVIGVVVIVEKLCLTNHTLDPVTFKFIASTGSQSD